MKKIEPKKPMQRTIEWMIGRYLPGYRLAKFRSDKGKTKRKEGQSDDRKN
jgi:hypothetical protein